MQNARSILLQVDQKMFDVLNKYYRGSAHKSRNSAITELISLGLSRRQTLRKVKTARQPGRKEAASNGA